MEDVIKLLKQILSSFSFGSIPKPVGVCLAIFSGVIGFVLLFSYAHLGKREMVLLVGAIAVMALATGAYYGWKTWFHKEPNQEFWGEPSRESNPPSEWGPVAGGQRSAPQPPAAKRALVQSDSPYAPAAERQNQPVRDAVRSAGQIISLLELTEPLFQYICRLNRIGRRGPLSKSGDTTTFLARTAAGATTPARASSLDEVVARSEIKALLEDMMSKAATDLRLSHQARKIELPLIFFVDSMISESTLPFASQWNQNRLAYERQELAGDEKFFDLLDETLRENG